MSFIRFYFTNINKAREDMCIIPTKAIREIIIDPSSDGTEIIVVHDHTKHAGTQLHRESYLTKEDACRRMNEIYNQLLAEGKKKDEKAE